MRRVFPVAFVIVLALHFLIQPQFDGLTGAGPVKGLDCKAGSCKSAGRASSTPQWQAPARR
jgi:hypothetical protein